MYSYGLRNNWPQQQHRRYKQLQARTAASAKLHFFLSSPAALIEKHTCYINYASPAQGSLCTPL